jgi:hypothetical protein
MLRINTTLKALPSDVPGHKAMVNTVLRGVNLMSSLKRIWLDLGLA